MSDQRRRIAAAVDPAFDKINLGTLRSLVAAADAEGFRDDAWLEVVIMEVFGGRTLIAFNEEPLR